MAVAFLNEYETTSASVSIAVAAVGASLLVVGVSGTGDMSAATWNGVALTFGVQTGVFGGRSNELWYLFNPAQNGTFTYTVTMTGLQRSFLMFFSGVSQTVHDTSIGTNSTTDLTVSVDVDKVGDLVCYSGSKANENPTWSSLEDGAGFLSTNHAAAYEISSTAGAAAESATLSSGGSFSTVMAAISFKKLIVRGNQVQWLFSRMRDFTRELKAGRLPAGELRRRYGDLMAI